MLASCLILAVVLADDSPPERTTMTGDWNGARKKMSDAGVDISASYANDVLGNPLGGQRRGFANAGSLGLNLNFDWEKIARAKGLSFFTSLVYRSGTNLSSQRIKNQFPVAQLFGSETFKLNEVYIQEAFEMVSFKVGRLNGGNDFLQSPLYYQYVSNAFDGNPIGIFFNTPFTAYPNATWGAYLGVKPHSSFLMKFAAYNANIKIAENKYHGANFTFKSTDGVLCMTEWVYLLSGTLPGNYKAGYYYATGTLNRLTGGSQKGNYGYYFLVDQMVYPGITPFAAVLLAPDNRNRFPFFFDAGVIFEKMIQSRPDDSISLGIAYGSYSSHLPQTAETVLEVNYWYQAAKWLAITPDIQYVIRPKGRSFTPNALVIGMQVSITL